MGDVRHRDRADALGGSQFPDQKNPTRLGATGSSPATGTPVATGSLSARALVGKSPVAPGAEPRATISNRAGRPQQQHYRRPAERPLAPAARGQVTILFGGLTVHHESLIEAAMAGLGYRVQRLPTPTRTDCQTGKEYCNPGQCNPSYFTVGALINHLKRIQRQQHLTADQIAEQYAYMTAGSCGPCRFGMYESEYRLALHNAGFPGVRVLVFQQGGGLKQSMAGTAIDFNVPFFLSLLNALFVGDCLNSLASQIRPYELVPGTTDQVMRECLEICKRALRDKSYDMRPGFVSRCVSLATPGYDAEDVARFLEQLRGHWYTSALRRCADLLNEKVEVDYTRARPKVKITGEFWAQTTDGDGNFRMFEFLEGENAEVIVEPVAAWITYMLHQAMLGRTDRRGLPADMRIRPRQGWRQRLAGWKTHCKDMFLMRIARWMIHREYDRLRAALNEMVPPLADQAVLRELARPYMNPRASGGEGHLEVGKTIYYSKKHLAHMVLSVKPFGCMPSTQSDGVQAAVIGHFPEVIFLPIETSPEGEVNAYSRVQMALGEAKIRCKAEFAEALQRTGMDLHKIRAYVAEHPQLRRPLQNVPLHDGIAGRAANFVLHAADRMGAGA
jgi:predicted nucleotide-binding protein (sugar kinase/HSP70/actin superfamily)